MERREYPNAWSPRQRRGFVAVVGGILTVGLVLSLAAMAGADRRLRQDLLDETRRAAESLNVAQVAALTGSEADLESPAYQRLKGFLIRLRELHGECRFVYLMGRLADGTVVILADSEPPESPDYSPPGDVFDEAGEVEAGVFEIGRAVVDGPSEDRWGIWISAYVPITDPRSGVVLAVFGKDVAAGQWRRWVWRAALGPAALTLALLALVLAGALLLAHRRRLAGAAPPWMEYLESGLVVAAGLVIGASLAAAAHGREVRARERSFSQLADSENRRVMETLLDLRDSALVFMVRFFEASEDVTEAEFLHFSAPLAADPAMRVWAWAPKTPVAAGSAELPSPEAPALGREEWTAAGAPAPIQWGQVTFPIRFVAPLKGNEPLLGFDLAAEPLLRETMAEAAASGFATAPTNLTLLGEGEGRPCLPILQFISTGSPPQQARGFILAVLCPQKLLRGAGAEERVHLRLSMLHPDGSAAVLAGARSVNHWNPTGLAVTRPVALFGRLFEISAHPGPEFPAYHPIRAGVTRAVVALLLSLAIAAAVGAPVRRRRELEHLVSRRSRDLEENEERFRSLAEGTEAILWEYDISADRWTYVAPQVERILGYRPEEWADLAFWRDRVHGEDRKWAADYCAQSTARGEGHSFEYRFHAVDGRVVWLRDVVSVEMRDGKPARLRGFMVDITDRREVEAERERLLAAAEQSRRTLLSVLEDRQREATDRARLVSAVEQAAEMVVITDPEGVIQYVNPAFETVTGYSRKEALGRKPSILTSGKQDKTFYRDLWATIAAGRTWLGRMVNRRKDGTLFTEDATISPVVDEEGRIVSYVAVKHDITKQLRLQSHVIEAQKLEAVGRLAGGVAHDFNNILQALLSNVTVLRLRVTNPELSELVREVEALIKRGAGLTQQLLLFSRSQSAAAERMDLGELVGTTAQLLRRVIPENIRLVVENTPEELWVEGNAGQLQQVVMNLAVNAKDAMPGGGVLSVYTASRGTEAVVEVADTGLGMDEETRSHLFEPFFTTKEPGKGTGLGLAVVHGVVEGHGGRIEVDSISGEGSRFRVFLPRAEAPGPGSPDEGHGGELLQGNGELLLIVEDEDGARLGLVELCRMLGYQVVAVASGEEAEALPVEPEPHILLTDLMLPGVSGPELAQRLRARWPDLEVVMMSGYTDDEAVRRGVDEGSVSFMQKPFSIDALARELRSVLKRSP